MRKGEICELKIEDFTDEGSGIGHTREGMAVFVKDTCVGDIVRAEIIKEKKNYCYGRLLEILEESEFRVKPVCPVARQCGGCMLQQMDYSAQLCFKERKVKNDLLRIGGIPEEKLEEAYEGIHGMELPFRYRNKMQFPVGVNRAGQTVTGFYAGRTHSIIPVDDCVIGHPVNRYLTSACLAWMNEYHVSAYDEGTGRGVIRHFMTRIGFATGEVMAVLVAGRDKPGRKALRAFPGYMLEAVKKYCDEKAAELNGGRLFSGETCDCTGSEESSGVQRFSRETGNRAAFEKSSGARYFSEEEKPHLVSVILNHNPDRTNRILGEKEEVLYGKNFIEDRIGGVRFRVSANSFFQVNPFQTEKLYMKALEYADLHGTEEVYDLYCGAGTISLFLAEKAARVTGVEIVPDAVRDARINAEINGITNAVFYTGRAEEIAGRLLEKSVKASGDEGKIHTGNEGKNRPDVVVVDPPRKGCGKALLDTTAEMEPARIVYVSCNPATLARDIRILLDKPAGYSLRRFSIYDQFPQSTHAECVTLLQKSGEDL